MSSDLISPSSFTVTPCYFTPLESQSSLVAGNTPPHRSSQIANAPAAPPNGPRTHQTTGLHDVVVCSPQSLPLPRTDPSRPLSPRPSGPDALRQDGYFVARSSAVVTNTQAQTQGPDLLVTSASNGVRHAISPGSSCQSSYSGQSLFIDIDMARLSPPPATIELSSPPNEPRSKAAISLTMVPSRTRSQTMPHPGAIDDFEHGEKLREHGYGRHHSIDGKKLTKNFEARFPMPPEAWHHDVEGTSSSNQRPPLINRRWSSFHSKHLEKQTLDTISEILGSGNSSVADWKTKMEPIVRSHESDRKPSLTVVEDLVGTIRQIMTMRKMVSTSTSSSHPASSITPRRASIPPIINLQGHLISPVSCNHVPRDTVEQNCLDNLFLEDVSETYLITSEDVEAITRLVDKHIQKQKPVELPTHHGPPTFTTVTPAGNTVATSHDDDVIPKRPSSRQSSKSGRRKSIRKAKESEDSVHAGSSRSSSQSSFRDGVHKVLFTQDQDSSGNSDDEMPTQFDFLHKGFPPPTPPLERLFTKPRKSTHEVIWKPTTSPGGSPLKNCELPEESYFTAEPASPTPITPDVVKREKVVADYFEAVQGTPSFFPGMREWPSTTALMPKSILKAPRMVDPQKDSRTTNASSSVQPRDSFKTTRQKKHSALETPRRPRLTVSETHLSELVDVISFPPLPARKTTDDWKSPLPPIQMAPHGQNLYNIGLDIHCGNSAIPPRKLNSKELTYARFAQPDNPEAPRKRLRSETLPHIKFKSAIQIQSKASCRTSVSHELGHCLDTSPCDRKTSSTKVMKCVTTIDNARKAQKTSTWTKIRPDSICPPPQPPTPTELRCDIRIETTSSSTHNSGPSSPEAVDRKVARLAIIQQKLPKTPEVDRVGIYGRFTGTGSANPSLALCPGDYACESLECHHCSAGTRNPSVDWIS
jgi:hypothetical protein